MKKLIKVLVIVIVFVISLFKLTEWYLESEFEAILNAKTDRSYDISYKEFDLHTFFTGITLSEVSITPLNKTSGTIINGKVDDAELDGFKWLKLLFKKQVEVQALEFNQPKFFINTLNENKEEKKASNFQNLFGDILSRIDLMQFRLQDGAVQFYQNDSILKGQIHRININATEIKTDSVQFSQIIPFYLGNLEVRMDSAFYNINAYTKAKMGRFEYSIAEENLRIQNLALQLEKDWVSVSKIRGIQDDVIEFDLKEVSLSNMNYSSNFWTNLDIEAEKMEIDSLRLKINRNKNLTRPPDEAKPLFNEMVENIPFNIDLDSINIANSSILYGELGIGRQETGIITLNAVNGSIIQLTTFEDRKQKLNEFKGSFLAKLNNAGKVQVDLAVPYDRNFFDLHTRIGPMPFNNLNKSLIPLLGVQFNEGKLKRLNFKMKANYYESTNYLEMDYEDLRLSIYEKESAGSEHKKELLTSIANVAIRRDNLPDKSGYITANYKTKRNIYRSPFQYIVAGVLDGTKQIVPVKIVQTFMNNDENKRKIKERRKKRRKKKKI